MSPSRLLATALLMALGPGAFRSLGAQTIATSGDPAALVVRSAVAGADLDPAVDAGTTYTVTTAAPNQRIVARLDAPLPPGVTITIRCAAPSGAASRGDVTLTSTDQEVVGPIPTIGTYSALAIVYKLSATVKAGAVPTTARSVTMSVAGP
ncbi:MAG TPA: hypothetical protein VGG84_02385 [Gemmatimonadaceae bacterium]